MIDRLRQKLLWRIHRNYQTRIQFVELPGLRLEFTRIANPDRVLDQVADAEDRRERREGVRTSSEELHLPYWAELWDSAFGIAQLLCRSVNSELGPREAGLKVQASGNQGVGSGLLPATADLFSRDPKGSVFPSPLPLGSRLSEKVFPRLESVLDLGCGMGLAGTVAAGLGADVTFADLERAPLLFAQLNSLPWQDRIVTRQLDWRRDRLSRRYQLILGADILYERAQWEYLEPFCALI